MLVISPESRESVLSPHRIFLIFLVIKKILAKQDILIVKL